MPSKMPVTFDLSIVVNHRNTARDLQVDETRTFNITFSHLDQETIDDLQQQSKFYEPIVTFFGLPEVLLQAKAETYTRILCRLRDLLHDTDIDVDSIQLLYNDISHQNEARKDKKQPLHKVLHLYIPMAKSPTGKDHRKDILHALFQTSDTSATRTLQLGSHSISMTASPVPPLRKLKQQTRHTPFTLIHILHAPALRKSWLLRALCHIGVPSHHVLDALHTTIPFADVHDIGNLHTALTLLCSPESGVTMAASRTTLQNILRVAAHSPDLQLDANLPAPAGCPYPLTDFSSLQTLPTVPPQPPTSPPPRATVTRIPHKRLYSHSRASTPPNHPSEETLRDLYQQANELNTTLFLGNPHIFCDYASHIAQAAHQAMQDNSPFAPPPILHAALAARSSTDRDPAATPATPH